MRNVTVGYAVTLSNAVTAGYAIDILTLFLYRLTRFFTSFYK